MDQSIQINLERVDFSTQVSIISKKDIQKIEELQQQMQNFDKEKQEFYQLKSKELKGIEVIKQELILKEERLKKEQEKMQIALKELEDKTSQLSDIQSKF